MGFTEKQQKIVDHRNGSLLVSAAAGSGKTSTLIAHVVERIREGGDLGRLIIVTYTRAAAGEMRERLRVSLEAALRQEPENRHLRHQLALLGQARISTIDSLCQRLVRSYFQMLEGISPDLRIAEEAELKLLSRDLMDEVLEEAYQEGSADFYALLDGYSSEKDHESIIEEVLSLYDSAQNAPFPERWLAGAAPHFPETVQELKDSFWMRALTEKMRLAVQKLAEKQDKLIRELEENEAEHAAFLTQLREERRLSRTWEEAEDYFALRDALKDFRAPSLNRKDLKADPAYEEIKEIRGTPSSGGYYSLLAPLRKPPFVPPEEELRLLKLTEAPLRALISLAQSFSKKLDAACRERGIASFMDMEHYALRLLIRDDAEGAPVPTDLARELQQGIDEIIVDEYQDINQVQEYILRGLSGEEAGRPNLFMVGDVKQSIYRFRRAEPGIFMKKYAAFSENESDRHRKILLRDNFRSRASVLQSANRLFGRLMSLSFGGVDYDSETALNPAAQFEGPDPKPRVLLLSSGESAARRLKDEGRLIAYTIRKMMDEKVRVRTKLPDGSMGTRDLCYRDIVILSRSLKNGAAFAAALKSYGIPAVAQENKGFYDTLEVQTLLSLLTVLDNPRQDIPLAAVMLSPIGGFTEEELALSLPESPAEAGSSLYERVWSLPAESADGRIGIFREKLELWRTKAGYCRVPELLDLLLEESGYDLYLQAMPSGTVRLANVRQLKEMAASYEESSYRGLHQFLRYVERQKDLQLDVGEAPLLSDGSDVVRIGTLHSSKGLEYPVVFLAGLGKQFNETDLGSWALIHSSYGMALLSSDREAYMKCGNLWRRFVSEELRRDGRAEELRLLYVGMTRAEEQLILVGSMKDEPEEATRKQADKAPEDAASFLDWLLQCRGQGDELGMQWEFFTPEEIPGPAEMALEGQTKRWKTLAETSDPVLKADLKARLDWKYPHGSIPKLSLSVSELKKQEPSAVGKTETKGRASAGSVPAGRLFQSDSPEMGEDVLSAAQKGTAFHKLMEHLPPDMTGDTEEIRAYIRQAQEKGIFSAEESATLDAEAAAAFFRSSLGKRALAAAAKGKLYREKPFILGVPYAEIDPDSRLTETVLLQGIIDMYFEEAGKLILIDYKTDRVSRLEELVQRYRVQLMYYQRALQQATDQVVAEVYLYSTVHKRFVALPMAENVRQDANTLDKANKM